MAVTIEQFTITGVIFDLDGTLVSSSLDFKAMRQAVGCPLDLDMLAYIDALECPEQRQQAHQLVLNHEHQDAMTATWLPGARQLVEQLNQLCIPQAIVTRNNQASAKLKVDNNNIAINHVISREHYPAKPDPSSLLAIAKSWQLEPATIMYVGDFRYDVEAANNAGMISCLVNAKQPNDYHHQAKLNFSHIKELSQRLSEQTDLARSAHRGSPT